MSQKIEIDGVETEVFTADEVATRENAAKEAVTNELTPKITAAEQRANERAVELSQARTTFTKLSTEQQSKLSETELALYQNQELLAGSIKTNEETNKKAHDNEVAALIRAKVGTDGKLFEKVKSMYDIIGLDDSTAEGVASRVAAAVGALGSSEPDLLASAGFTGGSFEPPKPAAQTEGAEASDKVKAGASELGLIIEAPKK